jgi:hypothetical protein
VKYRLASANGGVSVTYEDDGDLGSHCKFLCCY